MLNEVQYIIDDAAVKFDIDIIDDNAIVTVYDRNGHSFGSVDPKYSSDHHFLGWVVACSQKQEVYKQTYKIDFEYQKMMNKIFNTRQTAIRELIDLYSRSIKITEAVECNF